MGRHPRAIVLALVGGIAVAVAPLGACAGTASFFFPGDRMDGAAPALEAGGASVSDAAGSEGFADSAEGGDGGGDSVANLPCGTVTCSIPAESCCVSDPPAYACVAGSSCPKDDAGRAATALRCAGAAECAPGTVCCVYEPSPQQVASDCMPACGSGQAQLCDPAATSTGCSPSAGPCSSANVSDWGLPATYATCGGVGN